MKINYYYPYPANDGKHKYYIITKSEKKIYFGAAGYSDFPNYKDEARRQRYIKRHEKNESKYWNGINPVLIRLVFGPCFCFGINQA